MQACIIFFYSRARTHIHTQSLPLSAFLPFPYADTRTRFYQACHLLLGDRKIVQDNSDFVVYAKSILQIKDKDKRWISGDIIYFFGATNLRSDAKDRQITTLRFTPAYSESSCTSFLYIYVIVYLYICYIHIYKRSFVKC